MEPIVVQDATLIHQPEFVTSDQDDQEQAGEDAEPQVEEFVHIGRPTAPQPDAVRPEALQQEKGINEQVIFSRLPQNYFIQEDEPEDVQMAQS